MHGRRLFLLGIFTAAALAPLRAQTYLSEADAGEPYKVQGEYLGKVGALTFGVQVIAWGSGSYEAVILPGGLPGQGWGANPKDFKSVKGSTQGANTVFTMQGWSLLIPQGGATMTGAGPAGQVKLSKVFRDSPTLGWAPPSDAKVLFDGTSATFQKNWSSGQIINNLYLSEGSDSKPAFTDHTLHIEFRPPFEPLADNQERGNSGVYVQGRYEVQVLDSYGWMKGSDHGGDDSWAGGIYSQKGADFNMSLPPLRWQTYDIYLTHPKFSGSTRTAKGRITVFHNGVKVQDDVELDGTTPGNYEGESPAGGKLSLQNHGGPMWYRNIWVVPGRFVALPVSGVGQPHPADLRPARGPRHALILGAPPDRGALRALLGPSGGRLFGANGSAVTAALPSQGCYLIAR